MHNKILALCALGTLLSGCYMAPMALVGPAMGGFSTTSIIQTSVTTSANFVIKKSTGKTIAEHTLTALSENFSELPENILKQSYFPTKRILSKSELDLILRN